MKINRKILELYALGIFLLLAPVVLVADQLLDEKIIINHDENKRRVCPKSGWIIKRNKIIDKKTNV